MTEERGPGRSPLRARLTLLPSFATLLLHCYACTSSYRSVVLFFVFCLFLNTNTHLVPGAPPIKWVGGLEEEEAPEGERFPLFLADCTTAVLRVAAAAGALGGAAAAYDDGDADAGERALSRAAASPTGGVGLLGLGLSGLGSSTGGLPEAARMPFFFWRTLAMVQ